MMGYKVAVVGATGNVGREMLAILAERRFPADEVVAVASRRSMGVEVSFGDRTLKAKPLDRTARRSAEAAARQSEDQARGGVDLSVGIGRRQGRHGRTRPANQGGL